ncbi:hypothetical protein GRF29_106g1346386 [Pseudopithomyces chartarum]|uniref:CS domain-containing protein n=1 Tax=Pseudopithomyces chartarum TaxID=1892770 RepID=A0AAN6LVK3_9PLEO|nr:hypothetical protein GRF29_106g1346386 [Pseudopithomyces chartarum]
MAKKCVHKGCEKTYEDDTQECIYHPGPPVFHEGQKDDTPAPEPVKAPDVPADTPVSLGSLEESLPAPVPRLPTSQAATPKPSASPKPPEESEDDDPSVEVKKGASCKRRGAKKGGEEKVDTVRHDFYQTGTSVIASLYLKKIEKDSAKVTFHDNHVELDLRTSDSKRYATDFLLYGTVKPEDCKYRILGTKLELTLVKADAAAWPVLRSDDKPTGEMIQVGRAGRV